MEDISIVNGELMTAGEGGGPCICMYIVYICIYIYMSINIYISQITTRKQHGRSGWSVSVVKVCASMLCVNMGHRYVGGPLSVVGVFTRF